MLTCMSGFTSRRKQDCFCVLFFIIALQKDLTWWWHWKITHLVGFNAALVPCILKRDCRLQHQHCISDLNHAFVGGKKKRRVKYLYFLNMGLKWMWKESELANSQSRSDKSGLGKHGYWWLLLFRLLWKSWASLVTEISYLLEVEVPVVSAVAHQVLLWLLFGPLGQELHPFACFLLQEKHPGSEWGAPTL